jgi:MFS family permease
MGDTKDLLYLHESSKQLMAIIDNLRKSTRNGFKVISSNLFLSIYSIINIAFIFILETETNYKTIVNFIEVNEFYFFVMLFLFTVIFMLLGANYRKNYNPKINLLWNAVGIVFCILLFLGIKDVPGLIIYTFLGGFASGFCLPNVISAFLSKTDFNNRGSACGFFTFLTFILIIILSIFTSSNSAIPTIIALLALKLISLPLSYKIKPMGFSSEEQVYVKTSYWTISAFMIVWLIFTVAEVVVGIIGNELLSSSAILLIVTESYLIGLLAMMIGGILMDSYGRKKILIFAFAYLGLNYAVISVTQLFQLTVIDGLAWGVLTVLLLLVLWGDLCEPTKRTVSIVIAFIIIDSNEILTHYFMKIIKTPTISQIFPITSIFLFIAVVIILILPETIPERFLQKKELEDYIQKVKKVSEKYKKQTN